MAIAKKSIGGELIEHKMFNLPKRMHKSKNKEQVNHMRRIEKNTEIVGVKQNHISNY